MQRRTFLASSMGIAAAAPLAAQSASSASNVAGANDRIRVALIGCGGMGSGDLGDFLKIKGVECVALCDPDDRHVAEAAKNVVAPVQSTSGLFTTRDFRRVLERQDVDAVIVATPDHWHALADGARPARPARTSTSRSRSR